MEDVEEQYKGFKTNINPSDVEGKEPESWSEQPSDVYEDLGYGFSWLITFVVFVLIAIITIFG